jgi:predicted dehydrogenase
MPVSLPRLQVGLIGYGYAGKTFHAPLISAVPSLELVAVCSSDAGKVHADWPDVTVHATPAELIARADLDLVVIATPNDTHHPLARAALLAGRHVVVDKPFTRWTTRATWWRWPASTGGCCRCSTTGATTATSSRCASSWPKARWDAWSR